MNIERAFQLFDLDPTSSPAAIKQRYYDLAAVWHPDRHSDNSRLQKVATEKMKDINSAYKIIFLYSKSHLIIACHCCGANNIKRVDSNIDYATCSTCGKQLRKQTPKKQRIPCGNYRCAGTIGSNGRCNYCGKTIKEGRTCTASNASSVNNQNENKIKLGKKVAIGFFAFAFILLILYAYNEMRLKKNDLTITNNESAIGRSGERILTSYNIAQKPLFFKSNFQSIIQDDSYYSALFKNHEVNKEDAIKMQQILKTIGYKIGKQDGLINKNTILCLKQYSIDFGYVPNENFPGCFFENSFFHYQIALEHNDWLNIYLTSDLKHWIDTQSDDYRKKIYELVLEKSNTVVQLLRRYKFEKYKPLPKLLPETYVIKKNFSKSNGPMKIKANASSNNYYIKLFNLQNNQDILSAFIRSGSTLSVHVPLGIYELKYAAGHNWYGSEYLFGTSTSYAKLHNPIIFTEKRSQVDGFAIELLPSQYGQLTTEIISEFDF